MWIPDDFTLQKKSLFLFILLTINHNWLHQNNTLIGELVANEQTVLSDWYNSLTSKGNLNWTVVNDLCGQTGVICSAPDDQTGIQNVLKLYFFLRNSQLHVKYSWLKYFISSRDFNRQGLEGSISTQFGNLTYLYYL